MVGIHVSYHNIQHYATLTIDNIIAYSYMLSTFCWHVVRAN